MVSSDMGHPEIEEGRTADNVEPIQRPGGVASSGAGGVARSVTRGRGQLRGWGRGHLRGWGRGRPGLDSKAGKRPRGLLQFPTVPRFKGVAAFERSP